MLELNNMGVFDPKTREEIAKQFEKIKELEENFKIEIN